MTLKRSSAPDFTLHGVTWQCFVTERNTYEWRSACGRYAAWRRGAGWQARRGNTIGTLRHPTLVLAMRAAQADQGIAA